MDNLNGFRAHGITFNRDAGNQAVGGCPFCGKDDHFYANKQTKLWDCKRCGEKGNFEDFLEKIAKAHSSKLTEDRLRELADDRGIPVEAFRGLGIGWTGNEYTIPVRSTTGRTIDVRFFRTGHKLRSSPTASLGLYFAEELVLPENSGRRIFVAEGEWDAITLRWILRNLTMSEGTVVGVPGAATFKDQWLRFFEQRNVFLTYDNDRAGYAGMEAAAKKLENIAKSVQTIKWPENTPTGFDVRDLWKKLRDPQSVWNTLQKLIHSDEKESGNSNNSTNTVGGLKPIKPNELVQEYKKWLHLGNTDALKIMYGTIMANKLEGDPIWLFLVAPPGGSKSELLMSLANAHNMHAISSLTPHTMISGANFGGGDPSLLPKLKNKVLIIKDFTTILTMNHNQRDEIFGTLRDVYDGSTEKVFGNGVRRRYEVRFGVLAGVTPAIEVFNVMHQSLGERFLKFRISGNWDQLSEEDKILRALNNIGQENTMRSEMQAAANRWAAHAVLPESIPQISSEMKSRIVHLAKFSARLRGVVERDRFTGQVLYKPSSEVGTRIAKQLAKLGQGIAMFLGKKFLDEEVYALIRRVALDTVPDRVEDIVRGIWDLGGMQKTAMVVAKTRLPQTTVVRVLQDMNLLKLVEVEASKGSNLWGLSQKLTEHILKAQIYGKAELKKPEGQRRILVKRG